MEPRTAPSNMPESAEDIGSRRRDSAVRRFVDFADPAVWAWIVVAVLLALPAAATLA